MVVTPSFQCVDVVAAVWYQLAKTVHDAMN